MTQLLFSHQAMASLIRQAFPAPQERQACAVCGKYASITQAHHAIPVYQIADLCVEQSATLEQIERLPIRFVWLCPTHHVLFHAVYDTRSTDRHMEIMHDIGLDEWRQLAALQKLQNFDELFTVFKES
jgi:hypothetical protein